MKLRTLAHSLIAVSISMLFSSAVFAADKNHAEAMKAGMDHDKAHMQMQKNDAASNEKNTHSAAMKAGMTLDKAQNKGTKTASAADAKTIHSDAMKVGMSHDKALHSH